MDIPGFTRYWALWAAAVPTAIVVVVVVSSLLRRSAAGRLRAVLRDHREAALGVREAYRAVQKARRKLDRLESRAEKTRPRVLEEAKALLGDAQALEKIAEDKALVTASHVRRIIHEEFPPAQQEKLRARHLPGDGPDGRPFSFDA